MLTRQIEKGRATTEVVLQNARVLAVDQSADERAAKAAVAKSVTLEVTTEYGTDSITQTVEVVDASPVAGFTDVVLPFLLRSVF